MPKTLINYRASDLTLRQLETLSERWGTDRTETVTIAVDRTYRNEQARGTAMSAPIYTQFFVWCEPGEENAFPVMFVNVDEADPFEIYIRMGKLEDLLDKDAQLFVQVEHGLEYPYAKYDLEDPRAGALAQELGWKTEPVRYARAAVCFTPKMALL